MPKRILHIITGLGTGGAERMLVKLLEATDRRLFESTVVSLTDRGTQSKAIEGLGVPIYALGMKSKHSFLYETFQLLRKFYEWQPDLVHGWMYHGALLSTLLPTKLPILVGIRHSLHDESCEKTSTRTVIRYLRFLSSRSSAIVYCSAVSKKQHEKIGFASKHGIIIPNGFDTLYFRPEPLNRKHTRSKLRLKPDDFVIGHIARYHPMKDHSNFLEAAARMVQNHPEVRFLLAGPDVTEENKILLGLREKLGLQNYIQFLGEQEDVPGLLNALDVFSTSSAWGEAFPNVIGEAMACGVPCVATDIGDSAFIIGSTGFVVPPKNPEALATAWTKVLKMAPEERIAIEKKARDRIVDHFSLDRVAAQYARLYSELTKAA